MDESQKLMYELLKEVREDQKKDSEKITRVESEFYNVKAELQEIKVETRSNTKHMAEHMRRTDGVEQMVVVLQDLHADNQKRVERLESDSRKKDEIIRDLRESNALSLKTTGWFKDNIKWIVTVFAGILAIVTKMMELW